MFFSVDVVTAKIFHFFKRFNVANSVTDESSSFQRNCQRKYHNKHAKLANFRIRSDIIVDFAIKNTQEVV